MLWTYHHLKQSHDGCFMIMLVKVETHNTSRWFILCSIIVLTKLFSYFYLDDISFTTHAINKKYSHKNSSLITNAKVIHNWDIYPRCSHNAKLFPQQCLVWNTRREGLVLQSDCHKCLTSLGICCAFHIEQTSQVDAWLVAVVWWKCL